MNQDRQEYLEQCKQRARAYLHEGDAPAAVTSMLSDLSKHEDFKGIADKLGMLGIFSASSLVEARRFIEGFN